MVNMQFNFGNDPTMQEVNFSMQQVNELCRQHFQCNNCPMISQPVSVSNSVVVCEHTKMEKM